MILLIAFLSSASMALVLLGLTRAYGTQLFRLLPGQQTVPRLTPERVPTAVLTAGVAVAATFRMVGAGRGAVLAAAGVAVAWVWLRWWPAHQKGRKEQALLAGLPFVLDLLALAVGSGLGPVQALEAVASQLSRGPWREELGLIRSELAVGRTLEQALDHLEQRHGHHAVRSFVHGFQQALLLGAPLEGFLRQAAREQRAMARERMAARINALPAVLSVVTMVLLMPVIVVIVVLPNVLTFLHARW